MDTDRDVLTLADTNPKVDRDRLAEALRVMRELRDAGVTTKPGYSLVHPFARRPLATPPADAGAVAPPVRGGRQKRSGR